jgi:aminomethyltransferase
VVAALENVEVTPTTHDDVRAIRLEHGKPRCGEEITSRYLGPETGLAQAIARSKGCYLGQEVVERIRSRRLLGRVLMPVSVAATGAIRMGEKVLAGQKRVGAVASAVFSPHWGQVVGFTYLQTEFLNGEQELVSESSRAVVSIRIELASEEEI